LVLRLNQETVHDFILLFMPPCGPHLTPLATGSLERSLLVFSTPGGLTGNDLSRLFVTCTNTSKPQLAPAYLAKNHSTQHCQSLIKLESNHPPVLEPHMVLIGDILRNQDATGRIPKWAVELGALNIDFKPRTTIKSQALVDFMAEW
jgi:hypothetical protein